MGRILTNIFKTNYCRWYCKDMFFSLGIILSSYDVQQYVSNDRAYDKLSDKKDW
jgi:hypothetical protein